MNGMSTDHTIVSGTHVCIYHFDIFRQRLITTITLKLYNLFNNNIVRLYMFTPLFGYIGPSMI